MNYFFGAFPLILAGILYVLQASGYFLFQHRFGMTLTFIGYAIGNLGLLIDYYEMQS